MFMFSRKRTFAPAGDVSKQTHNPRKKAATAPNLWIEKQKSELLLEQFA